MTFEDYLKALGYTTHGEDNIRYQDQSGENVSSQALGQLQDSFNTFNQTDAQGRPVYGTEAYLPGTMSDAYGQGLFRLGQADAGSQLQPILDQMGASVQYDPRYGYVIPQAAQDEWSRQFGQPKGFDAFMENLASNAPIALGGAVLGAGLGYGPFAGGSLEGGAGGAIGGGGSGVGGGFGGADLGGSGVGDFDSWFNDLIGVPGGGSGPTGTFSSDMFGAGSIDPSFWSSPSGTSLLDVIKSGGSGATSILKSLASNPSIASGVGGLLGYLSGKNPTQQTGTTDIPEWLKPYYTTGLNAASTALQNSSQLTPGENSTIAQMLAKLNAPNAGLDAANQTLTDTASGKYLDLASNPQWQEAQRVLGRSYNDTIRPGTDAQFSRAGAFGVGNSAWEEMTKRNQEALSTGLGSAAANVWGQERGNQLNAAANMPAFQSSYLTGLGNQALQLGNYQRTQPWQGILNYGQVLGSTKGPSVTTQQTSVNPWQTAAGGALTGYGLSNLYNSPQTQGLLSSIWK